MNVGAIAPPSGLPAITSEDDVYKIGTLCQAKAIQDKTNAFTPYMLNLFPMQKAQLVSFLDKAEPLARVEVKTL